jgi:RHS repeat-associated protein
VLQVFNSSNTIVAEYTYDSWGNILSATGTQASVNPFRYRGYYYDEETGFYYLQSRYYDPEIGRFINADGVISTGQSIIGFNMFAYCNNNPINHVDAAGYFPLWVIVPIGIGIAGGIVAIMNNSNSKENEKRIDAEIKDSYSKQEATEEINSILEPYSEDQSFCEVIFEETEVVITNSVNVDSKYDRQKISTIITRTDNLTNRSAENLSSEWLVHNVVHAIKPSVKTLHVNLDYNTDRRWYVNVCTWIFDIMGWE